MTRKLTRLGYARRNCGWNRVVLDFQLSSSIFLPNINNHRDLPPASKKDFDFQVLCYYLPARDRHAKFITNRNPMPIAFVR